MPRTLRRRVHGAVASLRTWDLLQRDAVIYSASAVFAAVTATLSQTTSYRQWGSVAVVAYLFGAVASVLFHLHRGGRSTRSRLVVLLLVMLGATLIPLSQQVVGRIQQGGTLHAQPEVFVVEHSADKLMHGGDPYQLVNPQHPPKVGYGEPPSDAFDPYLPLMSVLGLASTTKASPRLTDARIEFSIVTLLLLLVSLSLCRGPTSARILTVQAMTTLPMAALPLATGGDDLPVAGFMLLAVMLLYRRKPLGAGLAMGIAASMKITAWPLALLAIMVVADKSGERTPRSRRNYLLGVLAVLLPTVVPAIVANVPAFVDDVVKFPLGLAGISSPADSPFLGHLVIDLFPRFHRLFTVIVGSASVVIAGSALIRWRPRTPAQLCLFTGLISGFVILLAPSSRIGYLLYPINLIAWSALLRAEEGPDSPGGDRVEELSEVSIMPLTSELVTSGAGDPPDPDS